MKAKKIHILQGIQEMKQDPPEDKSSSLKAFAVSKVDIPDDCLVLERKEDIVP